MGCADKLACHNQQGLRTLKLEGHRPGGQLGHFCLVPQGLRTLSPGMTDLLAGLSRGISSPNT